MNEEQPKQAEQPKQTKQPEDQFAYFTFGQDHVHTIRYPDGTPLVVNKNTIIQIVAPDPRAVMVELFDRLWGFQYVRLSQIGLEHFNAPRLVGVDRSGVALFNIRLN